MIAPLLAVLAYAAIALAGCTTPEITREGEAARIALVRRAAELTGNWTATTAATRYARFANIAAGDARRDAAQAAAHLAHDRHLTHGTAQQSSTILAIAADEHDANTVYVISNRRLTTTAGTTTANGLTIAHVAHTARGLRIDRWSPQP